MKKHTNSELPARMPYEKPELIVIELVADQVLATGCKVDVTEPGDCVLTSGNPAVLAGS